MNNKYKYKSTLSKIMEESKNLIWTKCTKEEKEKMLDWAFENQIEMKKIVDESLQVKRLN